MTEPKRIYDKGENRKKHLGTRFDAYVVLENGNEIGKCPKAFSLATAQCLIEDAIEEHKPRQPDVPFRLWNYHDGTVYQARTSDRGATWHGWPVLGKRIPDAILHRLEDRAEAAGEKNLLKQWLRKGVEQSPGLR